MPLSLPAAVEAEGIIVRRVIPSDNSCLFNAVGYVLYHVKNTAPQLRQVIAAFVASNEMKYFERYLGKTRQEYCEWILNPENLGGPIELYILATYYRHEIAVYDIQTRQRGLYGQQGYTYNKRVLLIFDGLHYDALAMSPYEGAPEALDQTIFTVEQDGNIGLVDLLALNFVQGQRRQSNDSDRQRNYTDPANFTLRCCVCQIGFVGNKEAEDHAQAAGHFHFQVYR